MTDTTRIPLSDVAIRPNRLRVTLGRVCVWSLGLGMKYGRWLVRWFT